MEKNKEADLKEFEEKLKGFSEDDFKGNTDFKSLTSIQKLEWLSQLQYLCYLAHKSKNNKTV